MRLSGPRRRNPRIRAALCYAFPLLPAALILLRERRNGFVRFHAARALVFFGAIILVQVLAFALVVILGNKVETPTATLVLGVFVLAIYCALAVCLFILWLRLLMEALAGRGKAHPYLDYWAASLESLAARAQARVFRRPRGERESIPI
jgi:uncharacterized membrane protein